MNKEEKIKFYKTKYKYGTPSHCIYFNWGTKDKTCHMYITAMHATGGIIEEGETVEVYCKCTLPENKKCLSYKESIRNEI